MKIDLKRIISMCTAAALTAALAGCGAKDNNSGSENSGGESGTTRQTVPTEPVVETLSGLDLSDVYNKSDVPEDFSFEAEAEDGELSGTSMVLDLSFAGDFSGDGYVSVYEPGDMVEFEVELPAEGSYNVTMICCADQAGVSNQITVDGAGLISFTTETDKLSELVVTDVLIPEGKHKIGIKAADGKLYVDKLSIAPAPQIDLSQYEVKKELSNPNASEETRRLYNFLTDVYGKYTISGQYECSRHGGGADSREFKAIEEVTGKTPAIMGMDLIEASPSRVRNGSEGGDRVKELAKDWYLDRNGIVTMCWHWFSNEAYNTAFYSSDTKFDLAKALDGSDPEGYQYLLDDIDAIAEILMELDDNHVPILWRPLHEGGGDPKWKNPWFWWGSSGADAYIQLWQLMYDRLTNYHNINNLIWVWNGQDPSYYPGDEYVDIIGYDIYAEEGDMTSKKDTYDFAKTVTDENKIIALTENGALFDPDAAFNDGTRWSWFCTWTEEFVITNMELGGHTPVEMWEKIYNSERVLTLDELPDLRNYPLDTEKYLEEHPDEAPAE